MDSVEIIASQQAKFDVTPKKYPKTAILIAFSVLCERFSYYGIRTILFLFLTSKTKIDVAFNKQSL